MANVPAKPEILAPAGGREQLEAAVRSGADAVYFGASGFNARRNARNFTDADFFDAVRYCRVRGVKANITLNTLIKDDELPAFAQTLSLAARAGANAVIVQDLAAAQAVKKDWPMLRLHASTQMAVHNVSGARLLAEYGFDRIVLARELSLREISAIADAVEIELEAFVHGAHCMSFSGLCYLSCMLGGRSANRGLCAQPCRLDFKNDRRGHALSLKDMSLVDHLEELKNAGVCSFKIEGRMKRPEYVAAAVDACRKALDGQTPDTDTLRSVFSRGGFTDGYLTGRVNGAMFGYRTKEDVTAAAAVFKPLQRLYDREFPRVPLTMALRVCKDEPLTLTVSDGEHPVTVSGGVPETALNVPLTPEKAAASLLKLGDTPYDCDSPEIMLDGGLTAPASALNALRREAVERLSGLRGAAPEVPDNTGALAARAAALPKSVPGQRALRLRFQTAAQFFTLPECERYILPLFVLNAHPELLERGEVAAEVPVLLFPGEEAKALEALKALKGRGMEYAVAENIGAVRLIREAGLTPTGGAHLNITNRAALSVLEGMGCRDNTASFELHFDDIARLRGSGKTGYLAYGHLPLMRLRSCPQRDERGCGDCRGTASLTDRKNEVFPLLCSAKRFSTLYNPVPLFTGGLQEPAADFSTLYFTVESKPECIALARAYLSGQRPAGRVTSGMYQKKLL